LIDDYDNLWIRGSAKSLTIFNEKRGSSNTISSAEIGLKKANVNIIAKDNKGEIWVGTDEGIFVYNDPGLLYQPKRPDFIRPYFAGFPLLNDKVVTAIKVDAANRKWIGTTSGIWLMNESGTEIIHYFNVDNSPLISNNIVDIEIEPKSGEVLIGTDKGIVSYRGNATEMESLKTSLFFQTLLNQVSMDK
jgi:ligand-binding sensor domain-containing protein